MKAVWANTAIRQRNQIFEYWTRRNKSNAYAKKLNLKIYQKIDLLLDTPFAGVEIAGYNARILHMENYGIVYRIDGNTIRIMAFWDNRQNPEKLLKFLSK